MDEPQPTSTCTVAVSEIVALNSPTEEVGPRQVGYVSEQLVTLGQTNELIQAKIVGICC